MTVEKRIPLFSMPMHKLTEERLLAAYKSTYWSGGGPQTQELADWFAKYTGKKYAGAVNSGTAACRTALFAVTKQLSDIDSPKMLIPEYSCGASLSPLFEFPRMSPIFADCCLEQYNMDFRKLALDDTVMCATIPFIYGQPIIGLENHLHTMKVQQPKFLSIIDISEAVGISKKYFECGDIIVASLRAEKMLGCGEGGLVATDNTELAALMSQFSNRGKSAPGAQYWYSSQGDNIALPNLSAAVALGQKELLAYVVDQKARVANLYRENATLKKFFYFQQIVPGGINWLNAALMLGSNRMLASDFISSMARFGIECRPGFYPLSTYWATVTKQSGKMPPNASFLARRLVVFPSPINLTAEDIGFIAEVTKRIITGG